MIWVYFKFSRTKNIIFPFSLWFTVLKWPQKKYDFNFGMLQIFFITYNPPPQKNPQKPNVGQYTRQISQVHSHILKDFTSAIADDETRCRRTQKVILPAWEHSKKFLYRLMIIASSFYAISDSRENIYLYRTFVRAKWRKAKFYTDWKTCICHVPLSCCR